MAKEVDRKKLYKQVWERPMVHVAKDYGVSGVALRKACVKHDIPVAERGHWAKLKAGYKVKPQPLPLRGPGVSQTVKIGPEKYCWDDRSEKEILNTPIPPAPKFEESLENLEIRIRKFLKPINSQVTLRKPHRDIARLLKADEERLEHYNKSRFKSIFDGPIFTNSFEQKRLRILNRLTTLLEKAGMKTSVVGKTGRGISITVGTTQIFLEIDSPSYLEKEIYYSDLKKEPEDKHLHVRIAPHHRLEGVTSLWEDDRYLDSEKRLKEIACSIIMAGEILYRESAISHHEWLIRRKENLKEEIRKRKEEEKRQKEERLRKLEGDRITHLLNLAKDYRRANEIREMVDRFKTELKRKNSKISERKFGEWSTWALAQADKIDPVVSGALEKAVR